MTRNQQAWSDLIRKAKRRIRNIERRGYEVEIEIPEAPKRITKSALNKLKKLTSIESIYQNSEYVDQQTGEVMPGIEGRRLERSRAARLGRLRRNFSEQNYKQFIDVVINQYREYVLSFPDKVSNIVLHALNTAISRSGKQAVAEMLNSKSESLSDFLNRSRFFGDSIAAVVAYCTAMFGDLPGVSSDDVAQLSDISDEEGS